MVFRCFSSDFLLPDADAWRDACWRMMRERADLHVLFFTKRIERHPGGVELVVAGGESDRNASPLDYAS